MYEKNLLTSAPVFIFLLVALWTSPLFADDLTDNPVGGSASSDAPAEARAWEKYALGLELLVEDEPEEGRQVLHELVLNYPDTAAAAKAREYLAEHPPRPDRSGIVTFYLGNMLTTTWAASSVPLLLEEDSDLLMGTAGLIGVGSGIYTSWLMTRGRDMSLGQDLWIEFIEAVSVANFQYAWNAFGDVVDDEKIREKINIGGQTFTALTSRGLTYWKVLDENPSRGRIFTMINTYAWAQLYYWISMVEIIGSENETLNNSLAVVVPDLAAVGSYFLWEKVDWSLQRAGIISVSGLGGMLTGIFSTMVISEAFNFEPGQEVSNSIILGCSLAGQVLGALVTSGMEPDSAAAKEPDTLISFAPAVRPEGTGFAINISF